MKFGRFTVLERVFTNRAQARWLCVCTCGEQKVLRGHSLRSGKIKSCGCYHKEIVTKHGLSRTKEYRIWSAMIQRCQNKNDFSYQSYGGRGIKICKQWEKFKCFYRDMGPRPHKNLTLERKNNDKGYYPENCYWATRTEQMRNTRIPKNNKTGIVGVSRAKTGKYIAIITTNYKNKYLGSFDNIEGATIARKEAEQKYWST